MNEQEIQQQLRQLLTQHLLHGETGQGRFVALPFEAGTGKSRLTDQIIGEHLASGGTRRFLIVKQFTSDVQECCQRIDKAAGEQPVLLTLGITSDNWESIKPELESLQSWPVLVITHERYRILSRNPHVREYFAKGRHTLIIDEGLYMPCSTFSEAYYKHIQGLLRGIELEKALFEACRGLRRLLENLSATAGNEPVVCAPSTDLRLIDQLHRTVEEQISQIDPLHRDEVRWFVTDLRTFYTNECVYNNGRISTYDPSLQYWTLQNNVILDASASMDYRYKFADNVIVVPVKGHVDHSKWTLYHVDFNTSRRNIRHAKDFVESMADMIAARKNEGHKTLVVVHKEFADQMEAAIAARGLDNVAVAYFGNIVGRNDWRTYNQVWIVANPLWPYDLYPVYWAMATGKSLSNVNLKLVSRKGFRGRVCFANPQIEAIRVGCMVAEIYQAIKRINRDNTQDAEVYLVHGDHAIVHRLQKAMRGIRFGGTIPLDIERDESEVAASRETQASRLHDRLLALPPGEYRKEDLREELGISKPNFARCLRQPQIQQLISSGFISVTTRSVIRHRIRETPYHKELIHQSC